MTASGPPALLVLEDGTAFRGRGFGAPGEAFGEAVFNTAMSGYQEVLTDPSYTQQIVTMTAPHQGNYGMNPFDPESGRVQVAGFVVRELSPRPSSWRSAGSLEQSLTQAGVVGVEGIDTRALTLRIRERGAMRAGLSTVDPDVVSLAERVRTRPVMDGADLAASVSCAEPYEARSVVGRARPIGRRVFRVAAYDFGIKRNILRLLAHNGCETRIFPARTPPATVLDGGFDGAILSNGPGDPAATTYGIEAVRGLLGKLPVFGICLGHQLMAIALGGRTYKLRFGHRGTNQPVKDLESGRVDITSHNHGFSVDPGGWASLDEDGGAALADRFGSAVQSLSYAPVPAAPSLVDTPFGGVALTHWNLNDGTVEGLRCLDIEAFSVQYHPEGSPGPHDSAHLFGRFRDLMA